MDPRYEDTSVVRSQKTPTNKVPCKAETEPPPLSSRAERVEALTPPIASSGRRTGFCAGQTMLEFAIVAPIFFFLIFGVMDYGRLIFVEMNLQDAVQEAARFASTGNHLPDPKNPGTNLSRVNSIIATAQASAFGASITNIQISSLQGGSGSAGGPGDVVTVSLTSNLALMTPIVARFFPNGIYTFTSSATIKNEPFPPGNTK
jgi:Flp pilus assembly protein TadG